MLRAIAAALLPGICSPEAKPKHDYQYPSARSDDAMWGQLVWSLMVAVAKSHIANMLPSGRVVSDRVILQEERGAPEMETPRHFDKENT